MLNFCGLTSNCVPPDFCFLSCGDWVGFCRIRDGKIIVSLLFEIQVLIVNTFKMFIMGHTMVQVFST
jgi:hypothetical protein